MKNVGVQNWGAKSDILQSVGWKVAFDKSGGKWERTKV